MYKQFKFTNARIRALPAVPVGQEWQQALLADFLYLCRAHTGTAPLVTLFWFCSHHRQAEIFLCNSIRCCTSA
jgi:hypothetical protein